MPIDGDGAVDGAVKGTSMSKRALLIGINQYQLPGANLRGCVNDVANVSDALTAVYGFTEGEITTLLDGAATKAAMQHEIEQLIDSAEPGDVRYLHYSGHGSNVQDTNGDETDGRDEILCPTDLDWNDPLTDDWLRTTFDRLSPDATLTVVMDCCHSGTNTREPLLRPPDAPEPDVLPRFLPNPDDENQGASFTETPRRAQRRRNRQSIHDVDIIEALMTGCSDRQTSADANIEGVFNGALTYYLVQSMRSNPEATYRELHELTLNALEGNYEQVPQLEGRAARLDQRVLSNLT
ncbi:MAG: caspase family protein [Humibacillus sp.]|nr:caspase family protein [Humibacillus sp.]